MDRIMKTGICILIGLGLVFSQALDDAFWEEASKKAKEEKAKSAAVESMRTDTTVPDFGNGIKREPARDDARYYVSVSDRVVDSLQGVIDMMSNEMYADKFFKKMKDYNFENKVSYLKYLFKYRLRDTVQVEDFCQKYQKVLLLECNRWSRIMELQSSIESTNVCATITLYVKRNKEYMGRIGDFLFGVNEK
jgi:hypothetical protein